MFWFKTDFNKWPKVDTCGEVQQFIDTMCEEYQVPPIKVIIRSTNWVEWFAGRVSSPALFGLMKVKRMLILEDILSLTAKNAEFLVKKEIL